MTDAIADGLKKRIKGREDLRDDELLCVRIGLLREAADALATPNASVPAELVEPVAWRWRYVRGSGKPDKWTVCQTPRYSQPAIPGFCAIEAEPLYAAAMPPAGRVEEMREALKLIADEMDGLLPYLASHHWKLDRLFDAVRQARAALSGEGR